MTNKKIAVIGIPLAFVFGAYVAYRLCRGDLLQKMTELSYKIQEQQANTERQNAERKATQAYNEQLAQYLFEPDSLPFEVAPEEMFAAARTDGRCWDANNFGRFREDRSRSAASSDTRFGPGPRLVYKGD